MPFSGQPARLVACTSLRLNSSSTHASCSFSHKHMTRAVWNNVFSVSRESDLHLACLGYHHRRQILSPTFDIYRLQRMNSHLTPKPRDYHISRVCEPVNKAQNIERETIFPQSPEECQALLMLLLVSASRKTLLPFSHTLLWIQDPKMRRSMVSKLAGGEVKPVLMQ